MSKIKQFFRKCKWLIVIELIVIIAVLIFNIFDNSVIIKELDPHEEEPLKCERLKESDIYIYYSTHIKDINSKEFETKTNIIKIEKRGFFKVKVLENEVEKEYKYNSGFKYYGPGSCMGGTYIRFENTLAQILKIVLYSIIIVDLFIMVIIKGKNKTTKETNK